MPLSIPGIELGRRLAEDAVGVLYAATGSTGPCCVRALREEAQRIIGMVAIACERSESFPASTIFCIST